MNLTKYKVVCETVGEDGLSLTPPRGAVDYETYHEKNPYGFSDHIGDRYFLFDRPEPPACSYMRGPGKRKPHLI